jgi:hypothetical protein
MRFNARETVLDPVIQLDGSKYPVFGRGRCCRPV